MRSINLMQWKSCQRFVWKLDESFPWIPEEEDDPDFNVSSSLFIAFRVSMA